MTTPEVILTADESRLVRALRNVQREEEKLAKTMDAVGDAGEQAATDIEQAFQRTGRKNVDEFEKLLRELRKTGPEGGRQARAIEEHLRATGTRGRQSIDSIVQKLGDIDPAAAEAAKAAQEQFAQMSEVVEGKLVKLATPMDKLKAKANEIFGPDGINGVKGYAVAIGGVTAALMVAGKGFELLKEKQAAAIESLQGQESGEKRLAQIATSAEDLDAMIAQADNIALATGMSREKSRGLIFAARSEGFAEDVNQIARFGQVVDTDSQGALAGSLGRLFKGEGLSVEQRLSGVLAAAEQSAFDFETVGRSVKKSAAPASAAGADLAETLAANATLANLIGESAGDRLKAFSSTVSLTPELQGKGIIGAVEALQGMDATQRGDILGEGIELNEAFKLLSDNLPEVAKITGAVRKDLEASASGQGVLSQRTGIVEGSERFQDRMNIARSEIAKEIAEEARYAGGGAQIREAQNLIDANLAKSGVSVSGQALLQDVSTGDIPLVGSYLPDASAQDVLTYGGNALGISGQVTSGAISGAVAGMERSNVPWYLRGLPGMDGVSRSLSATQFARDSQVADQLKEQTEIMREQLAAEKARQSQPTPPPVNYGTGLQNTADAASAP